MRSSVCVFPEPGSPVMPILTGAARRRGTIAKLPEETAQGPNGQKASVRLRSAVLGSDSPGPDDSPTGIYPAREDTLLLRRFATGPARGRLLEIGAGNGEVCLAAARSGWSVVATDRNVAALRRIARAARSEGLPLEVVLADLAGGLRAFDRVLANPPYLPTTARQRDPDPWVNLALDGGPDGLRVVRRILGTLAQHLRPRGEAFVLVSSLSPAERRAAVWASWRRRGGAAREVAALDLAGERLAVWRLIRSARPAGASRRGTGGRRKGLRRRPSGSSRAPARGRSSARGGASTRRRSPPGS